jgi:hypothetical protein
MARKRNGAAVKIAGYKRVSCRLDAEAFRAWRVTCAMEQRRPAELLAELIEERGRRWVVHDRPRPAEVGQGTPSNAPPDPPTGPG